MVQLRLSVDKLLSFLIILTPIAICAGKAAADIVATMVGSIYFLRCVYKRDSSYLFESWIRMALLLWSYSMIRSVFTEDVIFSLSKSLPWVRFVFFAAAIQFYSIKDHKLIKYLLITTSIAAGFLIFDSLFQYIVGKDIFGKPLFDHKNFVRLTGPFNKMFVGYITTTLSLPIISIIAYKINWTKGHKIRAILLAMIVLLAYTAVFLSGERSAFIQMTFGILMIITAVKYNASTIIKIIFFIMFLQMLMYIFMPQEFQRQFLSAYHTLRNFNESPYGILWDSGVRLGVNNIFLGVGPNNFELECLKMASFCRSHPHNIFIEWFAEYGMIGLVIFVCFIVSLLTSVQKFYSGIETRYHKYIVIGLVTAFVVKLLPIPSSGFFKNWYAVPFWFIVGWMMSFKNPKYSHKKFKH
ncbi:MAG: O-antigen ligase family protein [Rickettsiales bacterium]